MQGTQDGLQTGNLLSPTRSLELGSRAAAGPYRVLSTTRVLDLLSQAVEQE